MLLVILLALFGCRAAPEGTAGANKVLVRRYYEEVFNTGDLERLPEFVSPDYVEIHENTVHAIGLEGARAHVLGVRRVFPDLHITIEQQVAEGEWVATRITARGTQREEWLGFAPAGKPLVFTGVNLDRVVNGLIVAHGGAANLLVPLLAASSDGSVTPTR